MEIILALAAAGSYRVSDFAGGVLTRRAHVFVVFLLSQLVSFVLLLAAVALWADLHLTTPRPVRVRASAMQARIGAGGRS
jgi:hypothetical protein